LHQEPTFVRLFFLSLRADRLKVAVLTFFVYPDVWRVETSNLFFFCILRERKFDIGVKVRLSGQFILCLSPLGKAPPLFEMSSSRGLGLEVISQVTQKDKERLSGLLVLYLSAQGEPLPLFDVSSSGG
jgi:hypothetical protein